MHRSVCLAIASAALCVVGCNASRPAIPEDSSVRAAPLQKMPPFEAKDLSGRSWGEAQFKGKTVIVEFWATWCSPCHELAPDLSAFYIRNRTRVQLLSISIDQQESVVRNLLATNPKPNPVVHAGPSLVREWKVTQIPTVFLIRDGFILSRWTGAGEIRKALPTIQESAL